jgi:nucleoside-diphosphate-sugar epimerase
MTRWLVFGLSGQVGEALLAQWTPALAALDAVSRTAQADRDGLAWRRGGLDGDLTVAGDYDVVVSLGPLDHFAAWYAAQGPAAARVVAVGSTSVHSKAASPDRGERALAARLATAEDRLADACERRGGTLALLRPTLIYGLGRDRNLSRLVGLARRWRWLPLPAGARGLRQPVHAGDVAAAVLACTATPAAATGGYDLPGGETVAYDDMVRRALAAGAPGSRLVRVPDAAFAAALQAMWLAGRFTDAGPGYLQRLRADLVYSSGPAAAAFGYRPRPFAPTAEMFAR